VAEVKWIKIVTDVFDDEKILLIESMPDANAIIVCWFKLLCLAGKQNNHGVFLMNDRIAYTDEMLATIFRMPVNTVRMALATFEEFEMIVRIDGVITIPKWDKHQSLDAYERKKERDRNRIREKRAQQKALVAGLSPDTSADTSADVASLEEEKKEIRIEEDKKESMADKPPRASRFTPPTLEEVKAYCKERGNSVDPQRFIDFYSSKGWMVGKNKMKDWQAAVRGWESRDKKSANKPEPLDYGDPEDFYK